MGEGGGVSALSAAEAHLVDAQGFSKFDIGAAMSKLAAIRAPILWTTTIVLVSFCLGWPVVHADSTNLRLENSERGAVAASVCRCANYFEHLQRDNTYSGQQQDEACTTTVHVDSSLLPDSHEYFSCVAAFLRSACELKLRELATPKSENKTKAGQ